MKYFAEYIVGRNGPIEVSCSLRIRSSSLRRSPES